MSGRVKVSWRVLKRNTTPEHCKTKKFRWLGQRFSCVGEALCTLINNIAQLRCDWTEIHIRLVRGKEEGGGEKEAV